MNRRTLKRSLIIQVLSSLQTLQNIVRQDLNTTGVPIIFFSVILVFAPDLNLMKFKRLLANYPEKKKKIYLVEDGDLSPERRLGRNPNFPPKTVGKVHTQGTPKLNGTKSKDAGAYIGRYVTSRVYRRNYF